MPESAFTPEFGELAVQRVKAAAKGRDAEVGRQDVRQTPGTHPPRHPVDGRYEMQKALA